MARKSTEWAPSNRQKKVAEMLINPDETRSKTEILAEIGVPRRTFYNWMHDDRFVGYLSDELDCYTDGELPEVWGALIRRCKRGDTQAIKLFFELKNRYSPRVEVTGKDGGSIRVELAGDVEEWSE